MEIVWRRIALEDLEELRRYIAEDNPAAAHRVRGAIRIAVERLGSHPYSGRAGRVGGTRELVVPNTPYVVAYTVLDEQVVILSVIHGARRWPDSF